MGLFFALSGISMNKWSGECVYVLNFLSSIKCRVPRVYTLDHVGAPANIAKHCIETWCRAWHVSRWWLDPRVVPVSNFNFFYVVYGRTCVDWILDPRVSKEEYYKAQILIKKGSAPVFYKRKGIDSPHLSYQFSGRICTYFRCQHVPVLPYGHAGRIKTSTCEKIKSSCKSFSQVLLS